MKLFLMILYEGTFTLFIAAVAKKHSAILQKLETHIFNVLADFCMYVATYSDEQTLKLHYRGAR